MEICRALLILTQEVQTGFLLGSFAMAKHFPSVAWAQRQQAGVHF